MLLKSPRLLASAVFAAAVFAPASALAEPAAGSAVTFVPPTPASGTPLTGMQRIRAEASTQGTIQSMHLRVWSDDPSVPAYSVQNDKTALSSQQESIELDWDTATLSHNGAYRAGVTAETCATSCGAVGALQGDLLVANPPAAVAGVHAEYKKGIPIIFWDNRNREADLLGYRVFRYSGSPTPDAIGHVNAGALPFLIDLGAPQGVGLSYSVVAVRKSPVAAGADACGPFGAQCTVSAPSPATPLIAVPKVTFPGGGDPGGNPGGTPPDTGGSGTPQTPPDQAGPQAPPGRSDTAAQPPVPGSADVAAPAPGVAPAPRVVAPIPAADTSATGGSNGTRIVRTEPLDAGGAGASGSAEVLLDVAPPEPAPEGSQETAQLEIVAPPDGTSTEAFDRLEAPERDQTATVATVILLGLGLLGAYKARRLLRSGR